MALAPIAILAALAEFLLMVAGIIIITAAVIDVVKDAPVIGGWIAGKAEAINRSVTHAMGLAFGSADSFIGGTIHTFARFLDHLWNGYVATAHALLHTAEALARVSGITAGVRAIAHRALQLAHGIDRLQRELTKTFHGIEHRVRAIERELAHGIGNDVRSTVRDLKHEVYKVEKPALEAVREAEAEAQSAIDNLYEWAKGKASLLGIGTFATAVAAAIGLEAWNLLRCSIFRNLWGKRGCGLWQGLDDLLGLLLDALVLADLCEALQWLEQGFSEVEGPLTELIAGAADALCAQPPDGWATFAVPLGALPPAQTLGTLP